MQAQLKRKMCKPNKIGLWARFGFRAATQQSLVYGIIIANVYQVPTCMEGTKVSALCALTHYPHNLWSGYYYHACPAQEEADNEGLRGWLRAPRMREASEIEPKEPGSKVCRPQKSGPGALVPHADPCTSFWTSRSLPRQTIQRRVTQNPKEVKQKALPRGWELRGSKQALLPGTNTTGNRGDTLDTRPSRDLLYPIAGRLSILSGLGACLEQVTKWTERQKFPWEEK